MKINTATSMIAEPIFPKYSFAGSIEFTDTQIKSMLKEISSMSLYKYNWGMSGWNDDPDEVWNMTPRLQSASPLIVKQLFDAVSNQHSLPTMGNTIYLGNSQFYFEMRRCFPIVLYPGHDYPYNRHPGVHGAFSGITILNCSEGGHKVYTRNLTSNSLLEDNMKFWMPEVRQQIFFPNSVHWGISAGTDSTQTVALVSHLFLKRRN